MVVVAAAVLLVMFSLLLDAAGVIRWCVFCLAFFCVFETHVCFVLVFLHLHGVSHERIRWRRSEVVRGWPLT